MGPRLILHGKRAFRLKGPALVVPILLLVGVGATRADVPAGPRGPGDASSLPLISPAPDFALRSVEGPTVRLRDLRGKLVVLAFVCASCTGEPEGVVAAFVRLQEGLKARRLFGTKVALAFIVRRPEEETRTAVRAYARRLGADPFGWAILMGSAEVTRGLREQFGRLAARPGAPPAETRGRVFLLDYAGRVRRVYAGGEVGGDGILQDVEALR